MRKGFSDRCFEFSTIYTYGGEERGGSDYEHGQATATAFTQSSPTEPSFAKEELGVGLVTGDGGVDEAGVGVDAAGDGLCVVKALLAEPRGHRE